MCACPYPARKLQAKNCLAKSGKDIYSAIVEISSEFVDISSEFVEISSELV